MKPMLRQGKVRVRWSCAGKAEQRMLAPLAASLLARDISEVLLKRQNFPELTEYCQLVQWAYDGWTVVLEWIADQPAKGDLHEHGR